jgi:hypothetical protein
VSAGSNPTPYREIDTMSETHWQPILTHPLATPPHSSCKG